MGVPINNKNVGKENCPKISTACVIWQGPDIPCINLCAGDSIDEVVFKLASLLCTISDGIVDLTELDYQCLLGEQEPPTTQTQLIQLLIDKICNISPIEPLQRTSEPGTDIIVDLPICLFFDDESGDPITQLNVIEYSELLADTICSIKNDVFSNTTNINILNSRCDYLQTQIDSFTSSASDIYVLSQCASYYEYNKPLLIQDAFYNFEKVFCNLYNTLGSTLSLTNAILKQITNLNNLPQLNNSLLYMKDISGWELSPNTIADTINNIWLTLDDLRGKFQNYLSSIPESPCILLAPEDLIISSASSYYGTITWSKPSISGIQDPIGYSINVYDLSDTLFTTPLYSASVDETGVPLIQNIYSGSLVLDTEYRVNVTCIYSCGQSLSSYVVGKLLISTILFEIRASLVDDALIPQTCTPVTGSPVTYDAIPKTLTLELYNITSGLPVVNTSGIDLDVVVKFQLTGCSIAELAYENVTISIPDGNSSQTYSYIAYQKVNCYDETCGDYNKDLLCGVSISDASVEFNAGTIPACV